MGRPMARNLLNAGFVVHAWNRTAEKARPLADDGAQVFDDPAAAADGCPLMVTMLSDADSVLQVAEAALAAPDPPDAWIQMSTIGVAGARRCEELAADRNVTYFDAPVLGTRDPAEQGKLVILGSGAEGSESLRPAAEAVFQAVGSRILWLGEAGKGTAAKVAINSWVIGVVAVLAETITLAEALEVDPQVFFDAIEGGPLDLPYARLKGAMMMKHAFDDVSFRLALARKDGDLVLAAAAEAGLELPVMEGAVARMRAVEADRHGDEDMAATYWASAPSNVKQAR
jgi:3-hydroxyisobutyrate dehydrogenase